ncbi:Protein MOS2, putative [Ricinus communis]|uniref:Protein MOS2, putative n=1 Tax=Ricinus communis TaxID=3988 RepID=B9SAH9_RICCO|nr:Protein MOS2, putative [Ricinus communis]|eukprot:XP_002522998.1 protein MOS2 [Ricinus communis]
MKLSFSIPAKSSSKSTSKPKFSASVDAETQTNGTDKQFVTEFDPSKTLTKQNRIIIPPKENEWRPHKKMKNLALLPSLQSSDPDALRFEIATDADDGDDKSMSYGLNVRAAGEDDGGKSQQQKKPESTENIMLEKLRYDLERLPEDRGFDEFKDVPVEGFGAALLAGYGWREGRGIGRNAKEDVKVKQYTKRTDKEGLGFVASVVSSNNVKNRDTVQNDFNSVSNINNVKHIDNGQKERKRERDGINNGDGFFVGKDVRVIAGGREIYGLKGRILERLNADWVILKIAESNDEVKLRVSDIADLGSKEEDKCLRKLKALQLEDKKSKDRDNGKGVTELSKERRESVRRDGGQVKDEKMRWLRDHIRVRVISKDLKGGRFYLKKGEVVDVVGPYVCDISMDETKELVQGVDQDLLETALPRRGGPVLVLYGKHKGAYGNLVEKDLDRETGVVQDFDTREFLNVKLEQIAEYVGDPSYIGY